MASLSRHRGMLALLLLLMLAGTTVGSAAWIWSLPVSPATASREQLLRALVLQDLSREPRASQQAWVNRLQTELSADFSPPDGQVNLLESQRKRLVANVQLLERVWFEMRASQYAGQPQERKASFLREQIELLRVWSEVAALAQASSTAPEAAILGFVAQLDSWIATAEGAQREQMVRAVEDGTACWLATCTLQDYPLEVRRQLAERIVRELKQGAQPAVTVMASSPQERERLAKNVALLIEAYIQQVAASFAKVPANERGKFIDTELDAIEAWSNSNPALLTGEANHSSASALVQLAAQAPHWIEHAPPDEQAQVAAFVGAVQQRLLWRQLPAWLRRGS
ncbi:MAG TPA: hypothetical protein VL096_09085 [Pirellulaceae bacterium]|nr:hypothetical protein [Pirellulaceae bacterium]